MFSSIISVYSFRVPEIHMTFLFVLLIVALDSIIHQMKKVTAAFAAVT